MSYINPISLYGKNNLAFPLQEEELGVIKKILKAKTVDSKTAVLENAQQNEIERLIFKIQIPSYQELYYKLWCDKPLHAFLASGDVEFLKKENIAYSTNSKAYFKFWKPFFLWRYNIELGSAYFDKNIDQIKKLRELPFELYPEEEAMAYKDIKTVIDKDMKLLNRMEVDARALYGSEGRLISQLNSIVDVDLLNALPEGLASIRAIFAFRLLELAIVVYNSQEEFDTAAAIMEICLNIRVTTIQGEALRLFSGQLSEYMDTANQLREYSHEIKAHLEKLKSFQSLIEKTDEKKASIGEIIKTVNAGIEPQTLNALPKRFHFFADEYSKALRIFSSYTWNSSGDDRKALHLLGLSAQLPLNEQQAEQLEKDKASLLEKIQKRDQKEIAREGLSTSTFTSAGLDSNAWPIALVSIVLLAFLLALAGGWEKVNDPQWGTIFGTGNTAVASTKNGGEFVEKERNKGVAGTNTQKQSSTPQNTITPEEKPKNNASTNFPPEENRLNTGDSPYDSFYGKGRFDDIAQSSMLIKNQSGLDAVVCLEEKSSGRTIRNEYIKAGDQYGLTNIPEGNYTIKTFYGRHWDQNKPIKDQKINLIGGFTENFFFKKPDGGKPSWEVYDLNLSFTSYEIILNPVGSLMIKNLEPIDGGFVSWNIRDFGQTKDTKELELISKIIKNFDLAAIQEVVSGPGGAQAVALLVDELNRTGSKWDYKISTPTKSPLYKTERYAFIWKTRKVAMIGSPWLERSLAEEVYREPYLARFKIKNDTFLIANYHSRNLREKPEEELIYLFQLPQTYPKDKVIIAGDFNLETSAPIFGNIYSQGYRSSPHFQKTTLRTQCNEEDYLSRAIDHIFYPHQIAELLPSGAIDFVGSCDQLPVGRQISDHLPVWVQLGFESTSK